MSVADPEKILTLLRDPNVESQQIAEAAGSSREEAGRAARMVAGIARAKPEEALSLPPSLAAAVVHAALEVARTEMLAALATHSSREVSKAAKRGLHLLKTRGVAVPEVPRPAPAPPTPTPEPSFPCYASIVDSQGERALWISRVAPGKGVEVAQAIVSDARGLLELQVGLLGRKDFRGFARSLLERGEAMGVEEIDREEAKALVDSARALNETSSTRLPEGADTWLARAGPARPPEDPASRFAPLPEEEERTALEISAELHELPLLHGWVAEEDALRDLARKMGEIEVSPLYIDEQQRRQHLDRTLAEALESYLDEPRRRRLASRLFQVAAHLARKGDRNAPRAAAVARAVASGQPASRIPFVRALFDKTVHLSANLGPEAPAPAGPPPGSLIIRPGE